MIPTPTCACTHCSPLQLQQARAEDALEAQLGFPLFTNGDDRLGWLMNMQPVSVLRVHVLVLCMPALSLHPTI